MARANCRQVLKTLLKECSLGKASMLCCPLLRSRFVATYSLEPSIYYAREGDYSSRRGLTEKSKSNKSNQIKLRNNKLVFFSKLRRVPLSNS